MPLIVEPWQGVVLVFHKTVELHRLGDLPESLYRNQAFLYCTDSPVLKDHLVPSCGVTLHVFGCGWHTMLEGAL